MGRIFRKEITGIACDVSRCDASVSFAHVPGSQTWHAHIRELAQAVDTGWGIVLHSLLRSYCPAHAQRVYHCTCKTHPTRRHLCTVHDSTARDAIWNITHVPAEVSSYSHLMKGA